MSDLITRDVEYWHDGTRMLGYLCVPAVDARSPAILLIHDAFGVGEDMVRVAHDLAVQGHPVFIADVWGDRRLPLAFPEIGPLIGGMASDRPQWMARIAAAHRALAEQPECADRPLCLLGYCFGGASALEYLRTGAHVAGVVSIHGGLDLLHHDWSAHGSAAVLICTGAEDPMAAPEMLAELQTALTGAALDWQTHLYGDTRHAFTSPRAASSPRPEVTAYQPRSAARAWQATLHFLHEIAATPATAKGMTTSP
jgi:dienelactone hydrolase